MNRGWIAVLALIAATAGPVRAAADWSQVRTILAAVSDPKIPPRTISIAECGAVDDDRTDARPAILRAIARCVAGGGGHVVIPAGHYRCNGPIRLESNLDLHLEAGAVLRFGADPADYLPPVLSRYEGTLYYGHAARITAHGASNLSITGQGTIDGNARGTFAFLKGKAVGAASELRTAGASQVPVRERVFGEGRWLRPSLIESYDCRCVLVADVTLLDSTFWIIHPVLSHNLTVRHVSIESMNANNDGCDPDSCSDILVENCTFHTGDDSIAIKSGRDQDGWAVGQPTQRMLIRGCTFNSRYSALCIGSEMSGGVRDIFMEDCVITGGASAFYFKANLDRGGVVEGIRARRITVATVSESVVRFETNYHGYRGGHFPPSFRDFVIEDLTCQASQAYAVYLEGVAGSPIRDVTLRNVNVGAAREPLWLRQAEGIHFENVRVNAVPLTVPPHDMPPGAVKLKINS